MDPDRIHRFIVKDMVHNKKYGPMDLLLEQLLEMLVLVLEELLLYVFTRVLPSISVDEHNGTAACRHCSK